jgi:hypothetical protein
MQTQPATILLEIAKSFADHKSKGEKNWYGYTNGKTWGAIPFTIRNLYRGQNNRHFPLLPSIARGLTCDDIVEISKISISDQATLILRQAQSLWFHRELIHHPIAKHSLALKTDLNEIALAQHYGIPTGYLDLSDDFNVSAFFATCQQTRHGWEPVNSGIGVIYRTALEALATPFGEYLPLGPQPLPRPTEQCAWVTELPLCHSFEGWSNVSMLEFEHDRAIGEYFLEMFNGGSKLFPPDPLSEVADEILACDEIPTDCIDLILESYIGDPFGPLTNEFPAIRNEISKLAIPISYRRLLTERQISTLLADPVWSEKMLTDVTVNWHAVRRVPTS